MANTKKLIKEFKQEILGPSETARLSTARGTYGICHWMGQALWAWLKLQGHLPKMLHVQHNKFDMPDTASHEHLRARKRTRHEFSHAVIQLGNDIIDLAWKQFDHRGELYSMSDLKKDWRKVEVKDEGIFGEGLHELGEEDLRHLTLMDGMSLPPKGRKSRMKLKTGSTILVSASFLENE